MAKGIDGRVDGFFSRLDGFFDRLFGVGEYEEPFTYGASPWVGEPAVKSSDTEVESKPSQKLFDEEYSAPKLESKPKHGRLMKLLIKPILAYLGSVYGTKADEDFQKYVALTSLYNVNTNEMPPSYIGMLPIYNELARLYSSFEPQKTKDNQTGKEQPSQTPQPDGVEDKRQA